jgi:hypothetical protein
VRYDLAAATVPAEATEPRLRGAMLSNPWHEGPRTSAGCSGSARVLASATTTAPRVPYLLLCGGPCPICVSSSDEGLPLETTEPKTLVNPSEGADKLRVRRQPSRPEEEPPHA